MSALKPSRFALTLALPFSALAMASCAPTLAQSSQSAAVEPVRDPITGMDDPSTPADFAPTSSVLDTARLRPQYRLDGCEAAPAPSGAAQGALSEAIDQAKAYSDAEKGLGLIIMKDGEVLHESYAEGVDVTSASASASMMKSVLALTYGIAIEQGVIGSVDDPVGQYVAEWKDDPRGRLTLRQLLTMSAGLGQTNFLKILIGPDIAGEALAMEKVGEADAEFSYNNAISKVLTLALDRQLAASGKGGFLPFLQKELWCPLGNSEAHVWIDPAGEARGYAGMLSPLSNWARIGEMIRMGGKVGEAQVVPASWIAEMAKPSKANAQYGLHVWLGGEHTTARGYSAASPIKIPHKEPFEDKGIVYFDGFGGQRVYVLPKTGIVVARIGEVNLAFDDSVIPNLLTRAEQ